MAGKKALKAKQTGCCETETEFPRSIMEREKFCAVSSEGRKITDGFCCIIFLIFMGMWAFIALLAFVQGDPRALIYAKDAQGRLCGGDFFPAKELIYYPRLKDDLLEFALDQLGYLSNDLLSMIANLDLTNITLTGVCVDACPVPKEVICTYDYLEYNPKPSYTEVGQCYGGDVFSGIDLFNLGVTIPKNQYFHDNAYLCSNCWNVYLNTTDIFFRCFDVIYTTNTYTEVCTLPDMRNVSISDPAYIAPDDNRCITKFVHDQYESEETTYDNPLAELLGTVMTSLSSFANDATQSWWAVLAIGIGGAMSLGFLYIIFLRYCAGCLVWSTITGFLGFLLGFSGYCWLMSGYFDTSGFLEWFADLANTIGLDELSDLINESSTYFEDSNTNITISSGFGIDVTTDSETLWRVGAFGFTILFVVAFILVIVVAQKIKIAICIIEEASVAILRMPCLVFFPFFTAVMILANFCFAAFALAMIGSLEGLTIEDVFGLLNSTVDLNCTYNATLDDANSWQDAVCSIYGLIDNSWREYDLVLFVNLYQLFCFFWLHNFFQGFGIMVVAGAVADWYWTRPSFDKSVPDADWIDQLEDARSFHGLPEGVFVKNPRTQMYELWLNVDQLAITDEHIVKYDPTDSTHRILLEMRGYDPEPQRLSLDDGLDQEELETRGKALERHMSTFAEGQPSGLAHVHAGSHRHVPDASEGTYVKFRMENMEKWTGLRQGVEANGEDPRGFYAVSTKQRKCCEVNKLDHGLLAALIRGKVSAPGWNDKDADGVECWKRESKIYYPLVQDPRAFYGPIDINFGKIMPGKDHSRLNHAYVHQMTVAGKLKKGGNKKGLRAPFTNSVCRTLRFHLGSICVGSFIIAVVQLIRAIMAYIDKQTKSWQNKNKCYRCMFKVIHLCLCLLEKCLKFITKNAYIMVAMRGKPFCEACCSAFKLLLTNLVQFAIVGIFSKVAIFFGKLVICCATIVSMYFLIKLVPYFNDSTLPTHVNNVWIPVILTFLLSFGVAEAFLHVYDLAIATILLCFCEDFRYHNVEEASRHDDHAEVFMPTSLRNLVLPPESRRDMPHPMTYEEVRFYAEEVHKVPQVPHHMGENLKCCRKHKEVSPEIVDYNSAPRKKRSTRKDYEGDAAKAKLDAIQANAEAQEAKDHAVLQEEKRIAHQKLHASLHEKRQSKEGKEGKEGKYAVSEGKTNHDEII